MIELPHHKLIACRVAEDFYCAVLAAKIQRAHLRDQAERAAESSACNTAEGAGKVTPRAKRACFVIARGECMEALAAVGMAARCGFITQQAYDKCAQLGVRLYKLLT